MKHNIIHNFTTSPFMIYAVNKCVTQPYVNLGNYLLQPMFSKLWARAGIFLRPQGGGSSWLAGKNMLWLDRPRVQGKPSCCQADPDGTPPPKQKQQQQQQIQLAWDLSANILKLDPLLPCTTDGRAGTMTIFLFSG